MKPNAKVNLVSKDSNDYTQPEEDKWIISNDEEDTRSSQFSSMSNVTQHYFSIKMKPGNSLIKFSGSFRICTISAILLAGYLALYLINSLINNKCIEHYETMNCYNQQTISNQCQRLRFCIQNHRNSYFSLKVNLILIFSYSICVLIGASCFKAWPRARLQVFDIKKIT